MWSVPSIILSTKVVIYSVRLILAQTVLAPTCLVMEPGIAGPLDGHSRGIHLRHNPDFLGYRGILMTLRSFTYPGFSIYVRIWGPVGPSNPSLYNDVYTIPSRQTDLGYLKISILCNTAPEALFFLPLMVFSIDSLYCLF